PRPHLHFLELDPVLLLASFARLPLLLVAEFPVVHDPADRRSRQWSYLDQIQSLLFRDLQGSFDGQNADLFALLVDDPDGADPDLLVDTRSLVDGCRSRLRKQKGRSRIHGSAHPRLPPSGAALLGGPGGVA